MWGFERASRERSPLIAVITTFGLSLACGVLAPSASAQQQQRVSITVAPVIHAAPDDTTQLPVQITPEGVLLQNSFIRVRGLPASVVLSDGYAVSAGSWSVPLLAAGNLAISLPVEAEGSSELAIDLVDVDGSVLAQAKTMLVIVPGSSEDTKNRPIEAASYVRPDLDPSPLAAIQRGFDAFLANAAKPTNALTPDQKAETFRQFLTWSQNPLQVDVNVRRTSLKGAGDLLGTVTVGNTEIIVAGRKETALLIKPNLRGLRPGSYAFQVHEHANCDSALKDGEHVPGLGAGQPLWLSGTGQTGGAVFASYLGKLPHLEVDANGTAAKPVVAARLTLADVANRSLMIKASEDNHSARLACGRLN
jgi:Cu/Zn superoxide dismutase